MYRHSLYTHRQCVRLARASSSTSTCVSRPARHTPTHIHPPTQRFLGLDTSQLFQPYTLPIPLRFQHTATAAVPRRRKQRVVKADTEYVLQHNDDNHIDEFTGTNMNLTRGATQSDSPMYNSKDMDTYSAANNLDDGNVEVIDNVIHDNNSDENDELSIYDEDLLAEEERMVHAAHASALAFQRRREWKDRSWPVRSFARTSNGEIPIPKHLSTAIDNTLKDLRYSRGRGHEYKDTAYHLWHTAHRLSQQYVVIRRVLREVRKRIPNMSFHKGILDYGSSTGAVTWALYDVYHDKLTDTAMTPTTSTSTAESETITPMQPQHHTPKDNVPIITCIEQSPQLVDAHQRITHELPIHIERRNTYFLDYEKYMSKLQKQGKTRSSDEKPKLPSVTNKHSKSQNLVVAAYSLSRIANDQIDDKQNKSKVYALLDKLWNVTADTLVLIEHGDKHGFELIADAREYILHHYGSRSKYYSGNPKNYATCIAPCAHDKQCPMLNIQFNPEKKRICTFAERIIPSSLPLNASARHIPVSGTGHNIVQTFSYVVFHRGRLGAQYPFYENQPAYRDFMRLKRLMGFT